MTWLRGVVGPTISIIYMSESPVRNLTLFSKGMGQIILQPQTAPIEEIEQASLVLFPLSMSQEGLAAAVEWAGSSQTPIFCLSKDIQKLVGEGFGAYRFHKLDGYREIDFQGGTLEFFPTVVAKNPGIGGFFKEVLEWLGFFKPQSFHLLVRPLGEKPLLFLASAHLDPVQISIFKASNPEKYFGLEGALSVEDCKSLSKIFGVEVQTTEGIDFIETFNTRPTLTPQKTEIHQLAPADGAIVKTSIEESKAGAQTWEVKVESA